MNLYQPSLQVQPEAEARQRARRRQERVERFSAGVRARDDGKERRAAAEADRAEVGRGQRELARSFAAILLEGASPEGDRAVELAERGRLLLGALYPCSHDTHLRVADMYETDPRFRARFEETAAGLTEFVAAAIRANVARARAAEEEAEAAAEAAAAEARASIGAGAEPDAADSGTEGDGQGDENSEPGAETEAAGAEAAEGDAEGGTDAADV